MFRESLEIIRLLWSGGYRSYDGRHLKLEDARVFDLLGEDPDLHPMTRASNGESFEQAVFVHPEDGSRHGFEVLGRPVGDGVGGGVVSLRETGR